MFCAIRSSLYCVQRLGKQESGKLLPGFQSNECLESKTMTYCRDSGRLRQWIQSEYSLPEAFSVSKGNGKSMHVSFFYIPVPILTLMATRGRGGLAGGSHPLPRADCTAHPCQSSGERAERDLCGVPADVTETQGGGGRVRQSIDRSRGPK